MFSATEQQTSGAVSIMFAHQSTEAWNILCNSILGANMNITGSWANATEMTGALKPEKAFLSSSVAVSCRPNIQEGYAGLKNVARQEIKELNGNEEAENRVISLQTGRANASKLTTNQF